MSRYADLLVTQNVGLNQFALIAKKTFPLLYLIVVLLADHDIPSTTITPSFCALGLMGMSFYLSPGWMLLWGIVYSLVIICAFFNAILFQFLNNEPLSTQSIQTDSFARPLAFAVTAGFCTLFSLTRSRFQRSHEEILRLLSKFPHPIILSNLKGKILYSNDEAKKFLSLQYSHRRDLSFFDLFAPREKKWVLIAEYLQQIDTSNSERALSLEYQGRPLTGETMRINSMGEKILVTTLMDIRATHGQAGTANDHCQERPCSNARPRIWPRRTLS